jgi:hypothetical protein
MISIKYNTETEVNNIRVYEPGFGKYWGKQNKLNVESVM